MANPVDLLFQQPATGGAVADLLFGDIDGGGIPTVEVELTGTLPGLTMLAAVATVTEAAVTGAFPALTCLAVATYISSTARPTVGQVASSWQIAAPLEGGVQQPMQQAAALPGTVHALWQQAAGLQATCTTLHQQVLRRHGLRVQRFQDAVAVARPGTLQRFQDGLRTVRLARYAAFQEARRAHGAATAVPWQDGLRDRRTQRVSRWQDARPSGGRYTGSMSAADKLAASWASDWQNAIPPAPGMSAGPQPPVADPCYLPPVATAVHLLFRRGHGTPALLFFCDRHPPAPPGATVVVPVRSVYMTFNQVSLRRVAGDVEIPAVSLGLRLDRSSWTWSFNATVPREAQALLADVIEGEPVELEATINGAAYRLVAEGMKRDREFPTTRLQVQGRGLAALLDIEGASINFANTEARTAQQLMGDVLQVNGVGIGWDIDWQLTDWLVPAGAWAHQGSYISALTAIAGAVGGYLQPHPTEAIFRVLHRYPVAPWDWADMTPDFELPAPVTTREGFQWASKPRYNRVFVRGEGVGVLGQVTRAGTAGDVLAPMVTDALITHADAARQRGLAVLGDTGPQALVTLRLPVLAETGLILPGATVRYVGDGTVVGIVDSLDLDWSRPTLRQNLGIETHV